MSRKTQITGTNEEATPALLPKLRFPEFRGLAGWKEMLIAPFLEDCSGRVPPDTELPIYSSSREGLKRQDAYFDGRVLQNKNEYGVVPPGCFVYRHMSDDGLFKFNINETGGAIAVSKEYPVFSTKNLNPIFLLAKLNDGNDFKQFALSQEAGGTRTRLYFSRLSEWRTLLPSLAEQQKIAECLSSVDELIAAQARKVDALKTHKKGLMQQLFPREGETQPRLRYPEFQNSGEWQEQTLKEVFSIFQGFAFSSNDSVEQGCRWLKIADVGIQVMNPDNPSFLPGDYRNRFSKFAVNEGDYVVALTRPILDGELKIAKVDSIYDGALLNQRVGKLITHQHPAFVFLLLQTRKLIDDIERSIAGNDPPNLSANQIEGLKTFVPFLPEQQRIADCLSSLDALIATETQKHEALKTLKRGLMQQLFPSPEEIAA